MNWGSPYLKNKLTIFSAIFESLLLFTKLLLKTIDRSFHFMLLSRAISE
ncbi:hypothetical protein VHE8714_01530 [Vibrio splendidus]|nr:hypothetical protein VHE8714_01530 [Vibrio splendidus]